MIRISSIHTLFLNCLKILCVCSIFTGCATNSSENEGLKRESNRLTTPDLETRTVVWGNHSGAVIRSIDWLNDHKFLVVDRWVEEGGRELKLTSDAMSKRQKHMLSVAQKVGASLVVFVQVKDLPNEQSIPSLSDVNRLSKNFEVEIRGVNVETTDVVLGAKAWNSAPAASSNKLVMDLTTSALEKALKNPQPTLGLQKRVHQNEKKREQVPTLSATRSEEISHIDPASQPVENHPTAPSQNSRESVYIEIEEKRAKEGSPLATSTEDLTPEAELLTSNSGNSNERIPSSNSSVGIQIASGALSLLYTPFKMAYAVVGGFFGGFAYILTGGNEETAASIWDGSLGGTYLLQPEHLRGDESIRFMGESKNMGNAPSSPEKTPGLSQSF